ncbi:MAG TPA: heterodisulfide reductase-related iron-sulfur binding cluster [Gemmatimonadaceae bacterium]|nr:heterodisulfide reductase-related iron-sulfur binding cluster [Gemmatimonadaceae bacterium]
MTIGRGVFIFVVVVALAFFSYNAQRLVRYMRTVGRPDDRSDNPATRLRNLILIGFGQTKILRDPVAGSLHASVFWGFVVLTIGTAEIIISGLFPGFSYAMVLPAPIYALYTLSQELFALLVLAAVTVLLYRRIVVKPARLQGDKVHSGDAILILSMIGALMVSLLSLGAFEFALHPGSGTVFQPISLALSHALTGLPTWGLEAGRATSWWFHALLILIFLNYLPYSKHLHVLTSLPNTYLSNTSGPGVKGAMSYMDLEAEGVEQFGASDVTQLGWKNLLDSYSCTECGRCTAVCPANITGKLLSPRKIMINTRQRLMELAPLATGDFGEFEHPQLVAGEGGDAGDATVTAALQNTLLDNYITEEELWACTSCRACVQECPVSIDQLDIINELRRNLVLMESRFPPEIQPAFESMERNGSPWAFNPGDRGKWAEGMDIPTMAEMIERGERPEVLFWVGCMGSFDDRAKKIAVAFARVLQAAHVRFAILGQEEKCNGDPARRMGNEYLYQMLARDNIETLDRYGVETIVTNCPHCFHQIGNEYPQLGGNYEVIHHSTYIEKLLEENRLPLNGEGKQLTVAYHDSCYLGRYNDVYEAPRETLRRSLPMMTLVEPPRTRSKALCCGAGGGRMWMEETVGKRINAERTEELLATGADVLAVACPFCMTMIGDGVKGQNSDVPVYDISEVVAQQLL